MLILQTCFRRTLIFEQISTRSKIKFAPDKEQKWNPQCSKLVLSLAAVTMPVLGKYKRNITISTVTRIEGFIKPHAILSVVNKHKKGARISGRSMIWTTTMTDDLRLKAWWAVRPMILGPSVPPTLCSFSRRHVVLNRAFSYSARQPPARIWSVISDVPVLN